MQREGPPASGPALLKFWEGLRRVLEGQEERGAELSSGSEADHTATACPDIRPPRCQGRPQAVACPPTAHRGCWE